LINAVPYFIFLQVPSFSGSSPMKIATGITLVGTLWRVLMYVGAFLAWGAYPYRCYGGQDLTTIFNGAANLMGSFGVKVVIPEMIREMKKPDDFHKAWAVSQAIVIPLYIGIRLWGFALFGTFVDGTNLFNNFKNNAMIEVYFLSQLVTGYLPLCYGQILFFLKLELHYGVLPTDWFTVSNPETNRFPKVPPALFRLVWRGGMLALWLFLAEMLIGFSVFLIFSLVSAITAAAFSFYLPYVFAWSLLGSEYSPASKAMYSVFSVVRLLLSGVGVYSSGSQMASMGSAELFAFKSTCSSGSFFVGEWKSKNYKGDWGGYSSSKGNGTFHDTFYLATCGGNGVDGNINCGQACYGACCWTNDNRTEISCPPSSEC